MTNLLIAMQATAIFFKVSGVLLLSWWLVLMPAMVFVGVMILIALALAALSLVPDKSKGVK